MKTFLNEPIHPETKGIVYLCKYDYENSTIKVKRSMQFANGFHALNAYANIPNPESQMASGKDKESFEKKLSELHEKLNDPEWVKDLAGYL